VNKGLEYLMTYDFRENLFNLEKESLHNLEKDLFSRFVFNWEKDFQRLYLISFDKTV
jgi:hypothetical protein